MIKLTTVAVLGAVLFLSFSTKKEAIRLVASTDNLPDYYTVKSSQELLAQRKINYPILGKGYLGFKEALAFKESGGDYSVINQFGYLGKYQFGSGTLELVGVYDSLGFLNSPAMQEAAFYANTSRNKWILRREIKNYVGKKVNQVLVTESGILAAAHLAGPGNVKKFLRSQGKNSFSDAFGSSISFYMKKFAGYDTSFIEPNRKAKVDLKQLDADFTAYIN